MRAANCQAIRFDGLLRMTVRSPDFILTLVLFAVWAYIDADGKTGGWHTGCPISRLYRA